MLLRCSRSPVKRPVNTISDGWRWGLVFFIIIIIQVFSRKHTVTGSIPTASFVSMDSELFFRNIQLMHVPGARAKLNKDLQLSSCVSDRGLRPNLVRSPLWI